MEETKRVLMFYTSPRTRDEALELVKSMCILTMGWLAIGIMVLVLYFHHFTLATLVVLLFYSLIVLLLYRFKSRVAAILLCIVSIYWLLSALSFYPKGAMITTGVSAPLIVLSVRCVESTFK